MMEPVNVYSKRTLARGVSSRPVTITRLSIVIPVYHSEKTIGSLVDAVVTDLEHRYEELEIVLVNDGSKDNSHQQALQAQQRHPGVVKYLRLARNFGEHNAVMCGLGYVTGDCVAIIDDDGQNPVSEIPVLVDKLCEGYDAVYSRYAEKHHHWFRNLGSRFNSWLASKLMSIPEGLYLSSFKVINMFLVQTVLAYEGPYPYLDGLILRSTDAIAAVEVEHAKRSLGRSHYTLHRLIRLWLNMCTGFSILPLRVASIFGIVMSLAGFLMALFFVASWLLGGLLSKQPIPPGWASLIACVTFFAGIQLCVLGMVGEYLGRVFLTQNRTPQYVVREAFGFGNSDCEEHHEQFPG